MSINIHSESRYKNDRRIIGLKIAIFLFKDKIEANFFLMTFGESARNYVLQELYKWSYENILLNLSIYVSMSDTSETKWLLTSTIFKEWHSSIFLGQVWRLETVFVLEPLMDGTNVWILSVCDKQ